MKGKKTGGRQKGTPNKATQFSKELINEILSDYVTTGAMASDMKRLEPEDRINVMIKLAAFVTPKPQSIDLSVNKEKEKTIEDTLAQLAEENENV